MNSLTEILIGLILVILPIVAAIMNWFEWPWRMATIYFILGGLVVGLVMIGLLFLMLGISDLKG